MSASPHGSLPEGTLPLALNRKAAAAYVGMSVRRLSRPWPLASTLPRLSVQAASAGIG